MTESLEPVPLASSRDPDPLEYAAFIVYIKRKGSEVNNRLRDLCGDYQELVVQYVEDISPTDRPSWLRGVPTVVKLPSYAITVGTPAFEEVERWAAVRPKGVGQAAAPGTGVPLAAGFNAPLAAESENDAASRYSSLEDILRRRAEGPASQPAPPL
jgi:hypothetical protein